MTCFFREQRENLYKCTKPYQYVGGELLSYNKNFDSAKVRIALAFPDKYEIGISNLGVRVLYEEINKNEDMKTKLQKIKNLISEMLFDFASVTTDKGVIYWDEGEIAVDMDVYVEDETGEKIAAADGDYVLENGTVVKVAEGKVAEIVEPAEETVEVAEEPEVEENVEAEEVAEEPEVEETNEEVVENKELDEAKAEIERLKAELETANAKIAELEEEIKALKEEDAADTAEEQFKKQVKSEDRVARLMSLRK